MRGIDMNFRRNFDVFLAFACAADPSIFHDYSLLEQSVCRAWANAVNCVPAEVV